jgi:hypothetical protein
MNEPILKTDDATRFDYLNFCFRICCVCDLFLRLPPWCYCPWPLLPGFAATPATAAPHLIFSFPRQRSDGSSSDG